MLGLVSDSPCGGYPIGVYGINDCSKGGCWCEDKPCILIDVYLPSLRKKLRPLSPETRPAKL